MAERDPFSAPGFTRSGDGDATPLAPEARKALFRAKLLADTAGVPVWRSVTTHDPTGAIITTNLAGPVERVHVHMPPVPAPPVIKAMKVVGRLVWLPEGFMVTPRSPDAPDGWGMPSTPDGRGTPGGKLNEVIINRFANNQYPDQFGGSTSANLLFMDWELTESAAGMRIGLMATDPEQPEAPPVWRPQFQLRYTPQYAEPEGVTWRCHRPTEATEDAVELEMRTQTNLVRAEVDRPPLSAPLRGQAAQLATDAIYQVQYSRVFGHSSVLFREGHKEFSDRVVLRSGFFPSTMGENLAFNTAWGYNTTMATEAVQIQWRESPGHYANMIEDWSEGGENYAFCEMGSGVATMDTHQRPPYELEGPTDPILPPVTARVACQVLGGIPNWVHAESDGLGGGQHTVGINDSQDMFIWAYRRARRYQDYFLFTPTVTFRGRQIRVGDEGVDKRLYRQIAAGLRRRSDGVLMLRSVVLQRATLTAPRFLRVYEGRVEDFLATKAQIGSFALDTADASLIGRPKFSASGERFVFSVLRLVDADGYWSSSTSTPDPGPSGTVGHEIDFYEFRGESTGFVNVHSDKLMMSLGLVFTPIPETIGSTTEWTNTCAGSCRLFADYNGESIIWARIEVDSHCYVKVTNNATIPQPFDYDKVVRGKLVFPDGSELVYADMTQLWQPFEGIPDGAAVIRGTFRFLLPFSIKHPSRIMTIDFRYPEATGEFLDAHLRFNGTTIRSDLNVFGYSAPGGPLGVVSVNVGTGVSAAGTVAPIMVTSAGFEPHTDFIPGAKPGFFTATPPANPWPAALVSCGMDGVPRTLPRGLANELAEPTPIGVMMWVNVGPVILDDGYETDPDLDLREEELRAAHYGGQAIYAGILGTFLRGVQSWSGDARYYRASTLNLPEITGVDNLSDNILPIGVL